MEKSHFFIVPFFFRKKRLKCKFIFVLGLLAVWSAALANNSDASTLGDLR